ncbi:MAG: ATP-binding cassette domain-containing protein [Burkholderiales bacterium]|nr:ATP-binding cassette domain-containing protein [Burkholderiales bacterium]
MTAATAAAPPLLQLAAAQPHQGGRAFGPFDARVQHSERIGVLGPSGAGKSTLLRLLAGELAAQRGEVRLEGRLLAAKPRATLACRRAVLPQLGGAGVAIAFGLPVRLVVGLGRLAREPDPAREAIVHEALRAACALHLAGRRIDHLSGGEQARVQLARVLAQLWDQTHGLLLVDEPLAALDPALQRELMDTLQAYARERGHALVAVLHDLGQALSDFDTLWLVQDGRLAGPPRRAGLAALPALEALYGVGLHGVKRPAGAVAVVPRRRGAAPARMPAPDAVTARAAPTLSVPGTARHTG